MNATMALGLLTPYLPPEAVERARRFLQVNENANEVTFEGFSLWKTSNARNLVRILEKRVQVCPEQILKADLEKELDIAVRAIKAGREDQLWGAYLIQNDQRRGFILDLGSGEVVST
jgi:hypothetical protein